MGVIVEKVWKFLENLIPDKSFLQDTLRYISTTVL